MRRICFLVFMLMGVVGFSMDVSDSLWLRNSIRIDVGGTSFAIGFNFEGIIKANKKEKKHSAFTSWQAGINYPVLFDYTYAMPGIGIRRNWLSRKGKVVLYSGVYGGALICFKPTPKAVRNFYDSTQFYGGNYVNPIEALLFGEVGIKFSFPNSYLSVGFTPVFGYDRAYNKGFFAYPWGGIGMGFFLNKK